MDSIMDEYESIIGSLESEEKMDREVVSHSFLKSDFHIDQLDIQQTINTWLVEYAMDLEITGSPPSFHPSVLTVDDISSTNNQNDATQPDQCSASPINSTLIGAKRLKVDFLNFGKLSIHPQHFGKSGRTIPDGLCGKHQMYQQDWRFEINHGKMIRDGICLIEWTITNLASGTRVMKKETFEEAFLRKSRGMTICSRVARQALETRAKELELQYLNTDHPIKRANLESLIRALRPRSYATGLLFFGLLHEVVHIRVPGGRD